MKKNVILWIIRLIVIMAMIALNDYVLMPLIADVAWKISVSYVMGAVTIMIVYLLKAFED